MSDAVLAFNAGSSSIKFGLFALEEARPKPILRGLLEDQGPEPRLVAKDSHGTALEDRRWPEGASHADMLGHTLGWIEHHLGADTLVGIGHRIVHGGRDFTGPVRLDAPTLAAVERLTPLAPLHQPRSLESIRALRSLRPDLPQIGCFDTAFHHRLAPPVSRYAIPRRFEAEGVRKYGFHGLSYDYVASRLGEIDPALPGKRTIVAHLGNGASLCAMRHGRSLDTTMGFSALDGLVMGTRPGNIDPGVLLYLQTVQGLDVETLEHVLYHESGLLGVSGLSSDVRALEASDDPRASEALELFAFRVARETAALANTLGGLELLVFTGGIGEHSPSTREAICARLGWLGAVLDPASNTGAAPTIHAAGSAVEIRVMPTDEELTIARQAAGCVIGSH